MSATEAAVKVEESPHPLDVLDQHLAAVVQSASKRKAIIEALKDSISAAVAAAVSTYNGERQ